MQDLLGWKSLTIILGGLTLLGVFFWQTIRFWRTYSQVGGTRNLVGAILFCLFIIAWIVVTVRMVF